MEYKIDSRLFIVKCGERFLCGKASCKYYSPTFGPRCKYLDPNAEALESSCLYEKHPSKPIEIETKIPRGLSSFKKLNKDNKTFILDLIKHILEKEKEKADQ